MSVVIRDVVSIPASTTVENVIANNTGAQRYIRPPFPAKGRLMANVSIADLRMELVVNGRTIVDDSNLRVNGAFSSLDPLVDVVIPEFFVPEGSQLVIRSINPSAGAKELRYQIELEEAAERRPDMLVTQKGAISVAAGASVQLLTGLKFERPRADSLMSVFAAASTIGLLMEIFVEGQSVAPPMPIQGTNRVPNNPGDLVITDVECPQDKLIELRVQNTTGGAVSVFWRTELQELAFPS